MKTRQYILAAVALVSAGTFVASEVRAQEDPGAGRGNRQQNRQRGGMMGGMQNNPLTAVPRAFRAVNPTAEQQEKFEAVQAKMRQAIADIQDMDRQERRQRMQEMQKNYVSAVENILTDEQKPKFREEMKKAQQGGGLLDMLAPLNLTDEQKKKIEPIAEASQTQLRTAMQDQNAEPRARMEKMTLIMDEFKAKVRPHLTAEQQTKLDSMNMRGGRGGREQGGRPGGPGGNPRN
ncbi:MAG: hypothetical protein OHK0029_08970 [Armatimonadaceae bacterium]